jgi:TetR/AcrR family transcriptional regulator, tetracycline repressor protein
MLVNTALGIIQRKGTAGLTMRDLAEELRVSPMAAYYYVQSKDELLRLVGNHVWGHVQVPPPEAGPWYKRLRAVLIAERLATEPYRGLYEAVMYLDIEQKRALEDAVLDLMLDAGYPPAKAVPAFRTLMSWVQGFSFIESTFRDPKRRRPSGWGKAQLLTFDRDQMPEMHAEDYFIFGLDVMIAGLRETLDA